MRDTFESLILEAKAAGRQWARVRPTAQVSCADGRCVLGAVIHARKIELPFNEDGDCELEGSPERPSNDDAAKLLGIGRELAAEVIAANDGTDMVLATELDKLLGIAS